MKKAIFKLSNNIVKVIFSIFIILYALLTTLSSVYVDNLDATFHVQYRFGINIYTIAGTILMLLLLLLMIKRDFFEKSERELLYSFLILCFLCGLMWIFNNDPVLREFDDATHCFEAASEISKGNLNVIKKGSYLSVYPNNLGIMTYDLLHIKIFGENGALYSIRIVNLIFVLIGYFYLYKICDLLFNKNRLVNCIMILLMFGSIQFVFYSYFIYGNCISYSLAILSFYYLLVFLNDNNKTKLLISSISIVIAITIKQNSLIIMIAEIIHLILYIIKNKKIFPMLFIVLVFIGVYCGTTLLHKYWGDLVECDYNSTKLPTICWLAYGVNYTNDAPGHYTNQFEIFHTANGFFGEYTKLEAKRFISDSFNRFKEAPLIGIRFYINKFLASWSNPQYEMFGQFRNAENDWMSQNIIGGDINKVIDSFLDCVQIVLSIGLISYLINEKDKNLIQLSCAVIVIGGVLFHMFWEVKAIYLYQYYLYLLPYGAYGLSLLFNKYRNEV